MTAFSSTTRSSRASSSLRATDGRVVGATHGRTLSTRGDRGDQPSAAPPEWSGYPGHYLAYSPWHSNFRVVLGDSELVLVLPWGLE